MKERNAALLLLLTSLIWGFAFVAQSVSSESIGPFTFNSIRMMIGAIVLIPVALPCIMKEKDSPGYWKRTLLSGLLCGALLISAAVTQQFGVAQSGAGKGGFITSIYIIIVPFISVLMGKRIDGRTWAAAAVALIGMYLLCLGSDEGIARGDIFLIICAVLFSLHIMAIDRVGRNVDGVTLSMVQFLFGSLIAMPGMIVEAPSSGALLSAWLPILYAGAFSCGIAYTLQVVGQRYVRPSHAVLLLSLESVWAAIGGTLLLSERMSVRESIGCALVFAAVIAAQLPSKRKDG